MEQKSPNLFTDIAADINFYFYMHRPKVRSDIFGGLDFVRDLLKAANDSTITDVVISFASFVNSKGFRITRKEVRDYINNKVLSDDG